MSSEQMWHVARNNKQYGPFSTQQLQAMAAKGKLLPQDLVRAIGATAWIAAEKCDGLFLRATAVQPGEDAISRTTPLKPRLTHSSEMPSFPTTANKNRTPLPGKPKRVENNRRLPVYLNIGAVCCVVGLASLAGLMGQRASTKPTADSDDSRGIAAGAGSATPAPPTASTALESAVRQSLRAAGKASVSDDSSSAAKVERVGLVDLARFPEDYIGKTLVVFARVSSRPAVMERLDPKLLGVDNLFGFALYEYTNLYNPIVRQPSLGAKKLTCVVSSHLARKIGEKLDTPHLDGSPRIPEADVTLKVVRVNTSWGEIPVAVVNKVTLRNVISGPVEIVADASSPASPAD